MWRYHSASVVLVAAAAQLACSNDPETPGAYFAGAAGTAVPGAGGNGGTVGGLGVSGTAGANSDKDSDGSGGFAGQGGGGSISTGGAGAGGIARASPGGFSGIAGTSGAGGAEPALLPVRSYTGSDANRGTKPGKLNIGQEFTVTGSSINVRDLGVWDFGANGLATTHVVSLFALNKLGLQPGAGATLISGGSVTVPAGSAAPLDSGFRFATLPQPVVLEPGNYAVVAYGMSDSGDPYGDGGNVPYSGSGVSHGGFSPFEFGDATSPTFPNAGDQNPHAAASFHFTSSAPPFVRILPLGDSITDGQHGTLAGYRGPLHDLLDAAHYPVQFVGSMTDNNFNALPVDQQHHEGHSGYQIGALQDNLRNWAGPTGSPADIVLLMAGTNDIVFNNETDWGNVGSRLSRLISSIVNKDTGLLPKSRLIVAQLTPVTNAAWATREAAYNQTVAQVVSEHVKLGENVRLVDMHAAVSVADLFTDGEHPSDAGYKKMAKAWFDAIVAP